MKDILLLSCLLASPITWEMGPITYVRQKHLLQTKISNLLHNHEASCSLLKQSNSIHSHTKQNNILISNNQLVHYVIKSCIMIQIPNIISTIKMETINPFMKLYTKSLNTIQHFSFLSPNICDV